MKTPSQFSFQTTRKRLQSSWAVLATAVAFLGLTPLGLRGATIADWQFNAANPTADSSGNGNTLAFYGDSPVFTGDVATNAPGATNSVTFDGSAYAQTVATLNLSVYDAVTIECFAKYTPNGLEMFYAQNNPNNVVGAFYLDVGENGASGLKMAQKTESGFETDLAPGPTDGNWHHFALTIDESGSSPVVKIYVDGYEVDTGGVVASLQYFINDFFTIGAYPPTYVFGYDGELGEMRVSSGILTPSQFLIGGPPTAIVVSQQPRNTAALTNNPATFSISAAVEGGSPTPTLQYQWQINGTNISGATNSSYTFPSVIYGNNGSLVDVVLSATDASSVTSSNAILTVLTNLTVADWRFNAANPGADSSGNGNTLAFSGDSLSFTGDVATNAPNATNSATFDGSAYAQTAGTLNLSLYTAFTVEFFAKYDPIYGLEMFLSQDNPNNVVGAFYLDVGEAGASELKMAQSIESGVFETEVAPGPTDENWHHIALTVNDSGTTSVVKTYVDGYEVDTGTANPGLPAFLNDYFTIGAYPPAYDFGYDGELGEMRVSATALAPSQFLIGGPPPAITVSQQPKNGAALTNNPVTFSISAVAQGGSPAPTLHYQWQINGTDISGGTNSSYTFPSASYGNNGALIAVLLSATGAASVTSSNAILTVMTNLTIADWQFNAANPTADSSGNGNTLAFYGDSLSFTGDVATNAPGATNSATFDGEAYAQTAGTLNLSLYNAFTVEFFAKYDPIYGLEMFLSQDNPNNVIGAFYLDVGEAGASELKMSRKINATGFETEVAPGATDDNWHHIALSIDNSGATSVVKTYVDGYEVDTGTGNPGLPAFLNDYL